MPGFHPIAMPKPIKVSAPPKIAAIHIAKVGGGMKVSHIMDHAPTQTFAFQDPKKALQHLTRIQSSQWREPNRNEGNAVTRDLNLGPTS